jgi:peptidoglycan hydrolase-like protein with peptidoglycan-binding domain
MTTIRRGSIAVIVMATAVVAMSACGESDDAAPTAVPSTTAATDATASPTPTAASTTTASPRPTTASPRPTRTTDAPEPSESPTDDENGELAGQLIIEYPGTPLKRTTSTASNPDVVDLQVRLNEVGYVVVTNGVFNAATEKVVKAFQVDNGLTADGIVDASTWAALFTFEG